MKIWIVLLAVLVVGCGAPDIPAVKDTPIGSDEQAKLYFSISPTVKLVTFGGGTPAYHIGVCGAPLIPWAKDFVGVTEDGCFEIVIADPNGHGPGAIRVGVGYEETHR